MAIVQDRPEICKWEFDIGLRVSLLIRCCSADDEGITQIDQNISRLVTTHIYVFAVNHTANRGL